MKNKKRIAATIITAVIISSLTSIIPAAAQAATGSQSSLSLPCATSVNFDPYLLEYTRGAMDKEIVVPFSKTFSEQQPGCQMTLSVFNSDGEQVNNANLNQFFKIENSNLVINTALFEKQFKQDGTYTIKFQNQKGKLIDGVLAVNTTSGVVLGVSHQRAGSTDTIKFINLIFYSVVFLAGFYIYKAKKMSGLSHK